MGSTTGRRRWLRARRRPRRRLHRPLRRSPSPVSASRPTTRARHAAHAPRRPPRLFLWCAPGRSGSARPHARPAPGGLITRRHVRMRSGRAGALDRAPAHEPTWRTSPLGVREARQSLPEAADAAEGQVGVLCGYRAVRASVPLLNGVRQRPGRGPAGAARYLVTLGRISSEEHEALEGLLRLGLGVLLGFGSGLGQVKSAGGATVRAGCAARGVEGTSGGLGCGAGARRRRERLTPHGGPSTRREARKIQQAQTADISSPAQRHAGANDARE